MRANAPFLPNAFLAALPCDSNSSSKVKSTYYVDY